MMRVEVYSHFFKIVNQNPRITGLAFYFARKYTHMVLQQQRGGGVERVAGKTFAARTSDNSEFRFHIGQLEHFKEFLLQNNIEPYMYEVVQMPLYSPKIIPMKMKPHWVLKDYQEEAKKFFLENQPGDLNSRLAMMPTGTGKLQGLDAKIKIPGGWTTMGKIKLGQMVSCPDGSSAKVCGIYPQGLNALFRVTFKDGRYTEAGLDHLWRVYCNKWDKNEHRVITTREMITLKSCVGTKIYIQLIKSENIDDVVLEKNPYTFGVQLVESSIQDPNTDHSVPEYYLNSSTNQRLDLIRGLFTGQKQPVSTQKCSYITSSLDLAESVRYLVYSLGGMAKTLTCIHHKGSDNPTIDYRVDITHSDVSCFFEQLKDRPVPVSTEELKLELTDIAITQVVQTQCIEIDHPDHLYITDDFITTHNTVTAMSAAVDSSKRTLIVVLSRYMEKWAMDVQGIADISPKEIMLVQGAGQVKGLIQMARDKVQLPKFIIMSLTTIQSFFNAYERDRTSDEYKQYDCSPEEFCEILDVGNIIVDEVHEHLYSVFKLMLYSHVPKFIGLSGTLVSDDPFIEKIQRMIFPQNIRFDKIQMEKYIKVYPISYEFIDIKASKIKTTEFGSNNYSQAAFEKSLIRSKPTLENYAKLINYLVDLSYLRDRMYGDKLAIYAGSIAMCTYLTEYLKKRYPNLDIRRYCEDDPFENCLVPDIRVTTILSAGTAVDIPNLRAVIMTNSVNSTVANLQTLGRLRKLPDRDVKFYYLYCRELPKQVNYHYRRMDLFRDRVAVIKEFKSPMMV